MADDKQPIPPETIPIRDDEDFDHDAARRVSARQAAGVRAGAGDRAVRRRPRQPDVSAALRRAGVRAAAAAARTGRARRRTTWGASTACCRCCTAPIRWRRAPTCICDDAAVIGAPFFVMERRRGTVVRRAIPPEFGGGSDPERQPQHQRGADRRARRPARRRLSRHRAGDARQARRLPAPPDRRLGGALRALARRASCRSSTTWSPGCARTSRVSPPPTLLHNDWRLDNMMLDASDPGPRRGGVRLGHVHARRPALRPRHAAGELDGAGRRTERRHRRHHALERAGLPHPPRGGRALRRAARRRRRARCRTTTSSACSRSASCCSRSTTATTSARPRMRASPSSIRWRRCSSAWRRAAAIR